MPLVFVVTVLVEGPVEQSGAWQGELVTWSEVGAVTGQLTLPSTVTLSWLAVSWVSLLSSCPEAVCSHEIWGIFPFVTLVVGYLEPKPIVKSLSKSGEDRERAMLKDFLSTGDQEASGQVAPSFSNPENWERFEFFFFFFFLKSLTMQPCYCVALAGLDLTI